MSGDGAVFFKTVRNSGLFMLPREARLHKIVERAQNGHTPITPKFIGYRWKLWTSDLYIERIPSEPLRLLDEVNDPGQFIANIENLTGSYLRNATIPAPAHLDFYLSGAARGPRYNVMLTAAAYRARGGRMADIVDKTAPSLATAIQQADEINMDGRRVVSHLDFFPKNFIRYDRLYIIDWGEGYLGRVGFDAGAYLMVLFRNVSAQDFLPAAGTFLKAYLEGKPDAETQATYLASNRVFLARTLSWLLRPSVERKHLKSGERNVWRERLRLLGEFASARSWRDLGLLLFPFTILRHVDERATAIAYI